MSDYVYLNGAFVSAEKAVIPVNTHAFNYGTGCFEGIRAYFNEEKKELIVFRMQDHYSRLMESCKILHMKLPLSLEDVCKTTTELIRKNFVEQDMYIRPLVYKKSPAVGNFNLLKLEDGFTIFTVPMGRYMDMDKGIKAGISSWRRVPDNAIPPRAKITGSYVNTSLAKTESLFNGYDEALLLDSAGHVVEGSAENIFMIKKSVLITPPLSDDILQGITRDTVMQLAQDELNLRILERSIDRSEIYSADEVFLTGTGAEIAPVISVDGRQIGSGTVGDTTSKIRSLYFDLVHGKLPKYNHRLTRVKNN